ncbi:MAG TPA: hypothetical protein VGL08_06215 [Paraburkholderia sp.]|jgi:hypothetical protein
MSDKSPEIEATLKRVEETLQTAKHGLDDLLEVTRERRMTGLRNLIVFGRSVTFVLQNLRSVVGEDEFDRWYQPHQDDMKASPLMRYFVDARNALEKQGRVNVTTSVRLNTFSSSDIEKFGPPPANAKGFFIGDRLGGTGWEVELSDGRTERYYVELPKSFGEVKQHFFDFPFDKAPDLADLPIEELCRTYIDTLSSIVDAARTHFAPITEEKPARSRAHLRLVKG